MLYGIHLSLYWSINCPVMNKTSFTRCLSSSVLLIISLLSAPIAHGVWFEASGQAVVYNDNKQQAREKATQEAITQSLLFAGASVNSVQHMANGLLEDDRFEIRANGEVNKIELIDELYSDDIVTISIRADIFPQESRCHAADYKKNIVTAWYPLAHQYQATTGSLFSIGEVVPRMLQSEMNNYARHARFKYIQPGYISMQDANHIQPLMQLAREHNSQFVLIGEIRDISVETRDGSYLTFWKDTTPQRHFSLQFSLFDATTGSAILTRTAGSSAEWGFDLHDAVDPQSQQFWQSDYGSNIRQVLQNVTQQLDEALGCLPAYGRILRVRNDQLSVDIGKMDGVKVGDVLNVFQMQQQFDPMGMPVYQYKIHPIEVKVSRVYQNSSVLTPMGDQPLANIQANDYVVRR